MSWRRAPAPVLLLAILASSCRLPALEEANPGTPRLAQTSFLYAADGTLITELHAGENRVVVPFARMPQFLRDAVVAIEDKRFYQHGGVDLKALMRAAYVDITAGEIVEGGSTITQQYVKNVFVGNDQTLERKIREAALALQLEDRLTKDQILARYLNTIYFGRRAYGVQAAARAFFSRDVDELTLAQSALLAGLISNPSSFDPFVHPKRSTRRRNDVLDAMRELGMIDERTHEHARSQPIRLHPEEDEERYLAPHFVDYVEEWFLSNPAFGESEKERYDLLYRGGLRITTTLQPRLQEYAERAVDSILFSKDDPYAAVTAIDPRSGHIVAMVGGRDYFSRKDRFARVNLAAGGTTGRQAGSSFKTFALVAALEAGIAPDEGFPGSYVTIPLDDGSAWTPQNYEGSAYGTISMETATVNSVNVAYVNIEQAIGGGDIYRGARKVVQTAKRMGIRCCTRTTQPKAELQPNPSAVLGTNEVNTLEMASAYGTLAAGGYHVRPTPVQLVTDARGRIVYASEPEPRLVVEPAVSAAAVEVLSKVTEYGTGYVADLDRPQFGKTGTAQGWSDAWFVGAVPQLVAAVWVGHPEGQIAMDGTRIGRVTGGSWPAQIWRAFMARATARMPDREFPTPDVRYVAVDVDATQSPACLPNQFTPPGNIDTREFLVGTQPTRTCTEPDSYQVVAVPSVIGLSQARAESALRDAGFYTMPEAVTSTSQPAGTVIAQTPSAGIEAQQSSVVTITVAVRPQSG